VASVFSISEESTGRLNLYRTEATLLLPQSPDGCRRASPAIRRPSTTTSFDLKASRSLLDLDRMRSDCAASSADRRLNSAERTISVCLSIATLRCRSPIPAIGDDCSFLFPLVRGPIEEGFLRGRRFFAITIPCAASCLSNFARNRHHSARRKRARGDLCRLLPFPPVRAYYREISPGVELSVDCRLLCQALRGLERGVDTLSIFLQT
jgi:hypothetical protein